MDLKKLPGNNQIQPSQGGDFLGQGRRVLDLCNIVRDNIGALSNSLKKNCKNDPDSCTDDGPCRPSCVALSNIEKIGTILEVHNFFKEELFLIKKNTFEEIPMEEPEVRRYRVIQDSLELFRKKLRMDYAGIGLVKDGAMLTTHEIGLQSTISDFDALNVEIRKILADTKMKNYVHSCSSHHHISGYDAIFLFYNIQGEPSGYLLLNKTSSVQKMNKDYINQLGEIFYNQLYAIIGEEDALFMKKELADIRHQLREIKHRLETFRYDHLTGLLRRDAAMEIFEKSFDRIRRSKRGSVASVVIMDIDHFKKINDTFGHGEGDRVLKAIGDIFKNGGSDNQGNIHHPRKADLVCRWGGEEFLAVLEETDSEGAMIFAERIRRVVESLHIVANTGDNIPVTITIGIKEMRTEDFQVDDMKVKTFETFVDKADNALYKGKVAGRNRVVIA